MLLVERVQKLEVLVNNVAGRLAELGDVIIVLPVLALGFNSHSIYLLAPKRFKPAGDLEADISLLVAATRQFRPFVATWPTRRYRSV